MRKDVILVLASIFVTFIIISMIFAAGSIHPFYLWPVDAFLGLAFVFGWGFGFSLIGSCVAAALLIILLIILVFNTTLKIVRKFTNK